VAIENRCAHRKKTHARQKHGDLTNINGEKKTAKFTDLNGKWLFNHYKW
jgi:nitrite reductase/ring-hydroxylating ferredoxin subunit